MDLLQQFALGEIDAFENLVRQSQGDIYAWIMRIVRGNGFGRMEISQLGRDGLPPT